MKGKIKEENNEGTIDAYSLISETIGEHLHDRHNVGDISSVFETNAVAQDSTDLQIKQENQIFDQCYIPKSNGPDLSSESTILGKMDNQQHKSMKPLNRGRPLKEFDNSDAALKKLTTKISKEILNANPKTETNRSDAKFTTMIRKIKDIPDDCLKYIDRRAAFKSNSIEKYLRAFLESFLDVFVPLFEVEAGKDEMFDLFIDFMMLKFPIRKVSKIYEILEYQHSKQFDSKGKIQLLKEAREKTSKQFYKKFYYKNICFKLIIDKMSSFLKVNKILYLCMHESFRPTLGYF